ncbi:RNA polymerase sigma factor [Spirillospora sp. CA-255316]
MTAGSGGSGEPGQPGEPGESGGTGVPGESRDARRFTAIYDACRQRVWAYAAARAGRQAADDVVSETFAVAWRRLGDVPEPALPWLLGVARNVLRDRYREEARRAAFTTDFAGEPPPGRGGAAAEGDIAERVAERLAVLRAMAALPDGDREILILVAWQGLSPKDAAKVVGCSATALRVRLHRARKRLMRAVEDGPAQDGFAPAPVQGGPAPAPVQGGPAPASVRGGPAKAPVDGVAPARSRVRMVSKEMS